VGYDENIDAVMVEPGVQSYGTAAAQLAVRLAFFPRRRLYCLIDLLSRPNRFKPLLTELDFGQQGSGLGC
jgi:hypothetical protein